MQPDDMELQPRGKAAQAIETLCGLSSQTEPRRLPDSAPLVLASVWADGRLQIEVRGPQTCAPPALGEVRWVLGARLRLRGARGLLGVPLSALADRRVTLEELWPSELGRVQDAMLGASTMEGRLEALHEL